MGARSSVRTSRYRNADGRCADQTFSKAVDDWKAKRAMLDAENDATRPRRWAPWTEISELFDGSEDPTWASDQGQLDNDVRDPWSAHGGYAERTHKQ